MWLGDDWYMWVGLISSCGWQVCLCHRELEREGGRKQCAYGIESYRV